MLTLIPVSLLVLVFVDVVVIWAALRQTSVVGDLEDEGKFGRIISMFLSALFVALFVIYFLIIRNPWTAFGTAVVVVLLNIVVTYMIYGLMGRR